MHLLSGKTLESRRAQRPQTIIQNSSGGFAMEFNGTDEYLSIALPNNLLLASAGVTDFYSSGSAIAGWAATDVVWNGTETGKTYTNTITIPADRTMSKTISGLVIGQKYKLKCRYQAAGADGFQIDSVILPQSNGEWNTVSKIFTATTTIITFGAPASGDVILDYASIKHDQGFDLNKDQEMISHSRNALFNNAGMDWIPKDGSSNHTSALSTADKSEGTGSQLITATGAGDATDHHVKLPTEMLESCVAGKKYTIQGEARLDASSLTYGANILSGDGTSGWNAGNGSGSVVAGEYVLASTGTGYIYRSINITAGKIIKVVFKAKATSYTGVIRVYHGSSVNAINTTAITSGYVTYTVYTIAQGNQTLYIQLFSSHTGNIYFDDIEIYDATPITLTAQLGTKSVTSSALSIVAGTFTKFVLNFEATSGEVNQDLKLWLSGAGSVFVDKLSLTQAYDMWIGNKAKVTDALSYRGIFGVQSAVSDRYAIFTDITTGRLRCDVSHGTTSVVQVDSAINIVDGNYHNIGFLLNRTGNAQSFLDGTSLVTSAMSVKIGKFLLTQALQVGSIWADKMKGQVAYAQIIRFENISLSTFNSAITGLQYPTGGGAEEVLRLTFVDGTTINNTLKDYSPKNHTITGINIDSTNRRRVN